MCITDNFQVFLRHLKFKNHWLCTDGGPELAATSGREWTGSTESAPQSKAVHPLLPTHWSILKFVWGGMRLPGVCDPGTNHSVWEPQVF